MPRAAVLSIHARVAGPNPPPGRIRRSCSSGGLGTACSSWPHATWPSSRSARCRTTPRAGGGRRSSPRASAPPSATSGSAIGRRAPTGRGSEQPQVRGGDRHGPDPLGGRAAADGLGRPRPRNEPARGAPRARAPLPAQLRTDDARVVFPVGGHWPTSGRHGVRGAGPVADPGADARRRGVDAQLRRRPRPGRAKPACGRAAAPQRRRLLPAPGRRPRPSGAGRASPARAMDTAGLAGRAAGRRRGRRDVAAGWCDRVGAGLAAAATAERDAVEAEAASLPLPGIRGPISVRWEA